MGKVSLVKQWVSNALIHVLQQKYNKTYEKYARSYDSWIREQEAGVIPEEGGEGKELRVTWLSFEICGEYFEKRRQSGRVHPGKHGESEILIFTSSNGRAADFAESIIIREFVEHPQMQVLYGDEDVISPEGIRYTPWLKPDWSPDTFLSGFYFGNIFAVRASSIDQSEWKTERDCVGNLYHMCYKIIKGSGGFVKKTDDMIPVGHVDEILFHSFYSGKISAKEEMCLPQIEPGRKAISTIIPSKDNPDTLFRCIRSFHGQMRERDEVIVVDNGSGEENRLAVEAFCKEYGVLYLYRPMAFHFSAMCNLGAKEAKGELLLFLNDDVEVPDQEMDFLEAVGTQAMQPYAGAVGVKLLYPDSRLIQHAGICNVKLGPVHKLQFKDDHISYYYGWNKKTRNVIAVTGACLCVEKRKFEEAGQFSDELAVAFNDVALCFSLHEKGYYNAVMQDLALYHYESMSRGRDDESEKMERLLRERDRLYELYPQMEGEDPYFHKYFATQIISTGFELGAEYADWDIEAEDARVTVMEKLPEGMRQDPCLMISIEYAGNHKNFGRQAEYVIQGYAFVAGSDNARYEKKIVLKNDRICYSIEGKTCLRREVEENLPDQENVGLCGFYAVMDAKSITPGEYAIGVMAKDKCSRVHLINWTGRKLKAGIIEEGCG